MPITPTSLLIGSLFSSLQTVTRTIQTPVLLFSRKILVFDDPRGTIFSFLSLSSNLSSSSLDLQSSSLSSSSNQTELNILRELCRFIASSIPGAQTALAVCELPTFFLKYVEYVVTSINQSINLFRHTQQIYTIYKTKVTKTFILCVTGSVFKFAFFYGCCVKKPAPKMAYLLQH